MCMKAQMLTSYGPLTGTDQYSVQLDEKLKGLNDPLPRIVIFHEISTKIPEMSSVCGLKQACFQFYSKYVTFNVE